MPGLGTEILLELLGFLCLFLGNPTYNRMFLLCPHYASIFLKKSSSCEVIYSQYIEEELVNA